MSTLAFDARKPGVLGDAIPGARVRDAALVVAGAGLTAIGAQIAIHVPPSPVPVTGQTLAAVVAGAALGARRGLASQLLYMLLGLFLPIYSDGASGIDVIWGATGGYIVGFVLAAGVVGWCAEQHFDRRVLSAFVTFCAGQLLVFGIGVPWLKIATDMSWGDTFHNGFAIFIVGGIIKALLAAGLVPGAWRLVKRVERRD